SLGIDEHKEPITIYPNPTTNRAVYITNTDGTERIEIYDVSGRKIDTLNKVHDHTSRRTIIKFSNTSSGLYVLRVNETSKLIVVND
ncbi:MAG: T9SS type A sorting domain-containing protein, partial [Bacteroidota bacterium]